MAHLDTFGGSCGILQHLEDPDESTTKPESCEAYEEMEPSRADPATQSTTEEVYETGELSDASHPRPTVYYERAPSVDDRLNHTWTSDDPCRDEMMPLLTEPHGELNEQLCRDIIQHAAAEDDTALHGPSYSPRSPSPNRRNGNRKRRRRSSADRTSFFTLENFTEFRCEFEQAAQDSEVSEETLRSCLLRRLRKQAARAMDVPDSWDTQQILDSVQGILERAAALEGTQTHPFAADDELNSQLGDAPSTSSPSRRFNQRAYEARHPAYDRLMNLLTPAVHAFVQQHNPLFTMEEAIRLIHEYDVQYGVQSQWRRAAGTLLSPPEQHHFMNILQQTTTETREVLDRAAQMEAVITDYHHQKSSGGVASSDSGLSETPTAIPEVPVISQSVTDTIAQLAEAIKKINERNPGNGEGLDDEHVDQINNTFADISKRLHDLEQPPTPDDRPTQEQQLRRQARMIRTLAARITQHELRERRRLRDINRRRPSQISQSGDAISDAPCRERSKALIARPIRILQRPRRAVTGGMTPQ